MLQRLFSEDNQTHCSTAAGKDMRQQLNLDQILPSQDNMFRFTLDSVGTQVND